MELRWPLQVSEERVDGALLLVLTGRLGAAGAVVFGAAVAEAVRRGDVRLVVDLGGVDYVSSAGLRAVATAEDQCIRARGALSVCRLTEPVRIALDLGGLLSQLSIEPTREAALLRVSTPASSEPHA